MKDKIYILFSKSGIRSLVKKTKTMKSLPSGTHIAELNLEVDDSFFDKQIPKFNIKLDDKNILEPEIKVEEIEQTPLAIFFSEFESGHNKR